MDKPVLLTRRRSRGGLNTKWRNCAQFVAPRWPSTSGRQGLRRYLGECRIREAKNEQGMLEGRILVIENMLRNAVIIEEGSESGIVSVGTTVDVKDDFGKQTLTIVGPAEVDVAEGRISMESPVGKALLGRQRGRHGRRGQPRWIATDQDRQDRLASCGARQAHAPRPGGEDRPHAIRRPLRGAPAQGR